MKKTNPLAPHPFHGQHTGRPMRPAVHPAAGTARRMPVGRPSTLLAALLLSLGPGPTALAQGAPPAPAQSNIDIKDVQAPGLYLLPRVEFEFETLRNRRLESKDIRQIDDYKPAAIMALRWQGEGRWALVNETEFRYDTKHETDRGTEGKAKLFINQLYGEAQLPEWNSAVRIGRWGFKDDREWLADTELDGVQLLHQRDDWKATVFAARRNRWEKDLLHDTDTRGDGTNYIGLMGAYELGDKHDLVVRVFDQRHSDSDLRLTHYSVASYASPRKGPFQHWAMLSLVDGKDQGTKVQGQAIDVGGTWLVSDEGYRPRVTLGYAWGSGDANPDDGKDRAHRQTGLQDNQGRFGGQSSFRLYGETLDPTLSNLHVLTAGIGMAPGKRSSLDLVYHHYRQDKVADVRDTNLRPRHDRQTERHLGNGIDLIWGWRADRRLKLEAAAGMFQPNERFRDGRGASAAKAKTAYSAWFEVKYQLQ
ncbi:MAG: alginate export family protein [Lautropia sp.]|nr:alginate export family protein [Lautropia sp.]